eukprot:m.220790 g.220790  ORF g.220790 m.220790 type:complete len:95 (+) comp10455_c0_seq1:36-320(+)
MDPTSPKDLDRSRFAAGRLPYAKNKSVRRAPQRTTPAQQWTNFEKPRASYRGPGDNVDMVGRAPAHARLPERAGHRRRADIRADIAIDLEYNLF